MKTITVRLSDQMVAEIQAESQKRGLTKSDVIRERLQQKHPKHATALDSIADLIGSVDRLPSDLSMRKKARLRNTNYGRAALVNRKLENI
jgi:hypothetical protein